jgi:hypothetical protein
VRIVSHHVDHSRPDGELRHEPTAMRVGETTRLTGELEHADSALARAVMFTSDSARAASVMYTTRLSESTTARRPFARRYQRPQHLPTPRRFDERTAPAASGRSVGSPTITGTPLLELRTIVPMRPYLQTMKWSAVSDSVSCDVASDTAETASASVSAKIANV